VGYSCEKSITKKSLSQRRKVEPGPAKNAILLVRRKYSQKEQPQGNKKYIHKKSRLGRMDPQYTPDVGVNKKVA